MAFCAKKKMHVFACKDEHLLSACYYVLSLKKKKEREKKKTLIIAVPKWLWMKYSSKIAPLDYYRHVSKLYCRKLAHIKLYRKHVSIM